MTEVVGSIGRAEAYDRHRGRYGPELSAAFLRFAGIERGTRVLDVGCGPGSLTSALAQLVGATSVAAVDPSEDFVRACRLRVSRADVRAATAEALPFADRTFDAVLSQLVIQALVDAAEAAREMHRVARPGGVVAACVRDFRGGMPLLDAYWSAAMAVDPDGAREAAGDQSDPWCTRAGLDRLWRKAGLRDVETAELSAAADYEDFDDAWYSFAAGASPSGAYCQSLDERCATPSASASANPPARSAWRLAHGPCAAGERRMRDLAEAPAIGVATAATMTVEDLLERARSRLERLDPIDADAAVRGGALLIDIRSDSQRARDGPVPGALFVPRNALEWRCDPASPHRDPRIDGHARTLILMCDEGYQSSLAAAMLHELGLTRTTDLIGGFQAWRAAGLLVEPAASEV